MKPSLTEILKRSAERHASLCPRQVLGVRMGLAGLAAIDVQAPVNKSTAMVIVETDGCFVDGIEAATGATIGHRTLRVQYYGKIAATFIRVPDGKAYRVSPDPDARVRAEQYIPAAKDRYDAQLKGYQVMPNDELLHVQEVTLHPSLEALQSRPDARVQCSTCGEEIINQRELLLEGITYCVSCAHQGYYETCIDMTESQAVDRPRAR